uniref:Mitogen-activated protein kinase n=1 Tax=Albugo laibachii Nc14 TaxID=890382 RepID=F0W4U8_9STRA|nr:mitogenactivated protein kinase putative [Albugo laibachii Nc14]CCA25097.1 mitogenactivated protein kinase putative [Albugo laibachii Nc14]|eukprot:CCA25097.1 mitogenactivated protein kinase putative [Albugo laibachii Nc14]
MTTSSAQSIGETKINDGLNRKRKVTSSSGEAISNSRAQNCFETYAFAKHQRLATNAATPRALKAHMAPTPQLSQKEMPPTPISSEVISEFESSMMDMKSNDGAESTGMTTPIANQRSGVDESLKDGDDAHKSSPAQTRAPSRENTSSSAPGISPMLSEQFRNWSLPSSYRLVRLLGKGSYGQVVEAYDIIRGKKVAIKKVMDVFQQSLDCKRIYREIHIVQHLQYVTHGQVIRLLDVFPPVSKIFGNHLYLVFEFLDTDLQKLIMSPQYLTIKHIQVFLYQLLCGLNYIHSANVIHRDLKPANILLNEDCTLMICDFGLARVVDVTRSREERTKHLHSPIDYLTNRSSIPSSDTSACIHQQPPTVRRQLTKHVVTRWYRAPELILLQDYSFAVDMWSVGCIFAELLSMQAESCPRYQDRAPLFPGRSCFPLSADRPTTYSDKLDQLNVIFSVIGTPSDADIEKATEVKQYLQKLPKKAPRDLVEMYPGAPAEALDLLQKLLLFNPDARIRVEDALGHPFLQSVRRAQAETTAKIPFNMEFENLHSTKEDLEDRIQRQVQIFAQYNLRSA